MGQHKPEAHYTNPDYLAYCPWCEQLLKPDKFYKDAGRSDGLAGYCKRCIYLRRGIRSKRTHKQCPACKRVLLKTKFNHNSKRSDGLQYYCKACMRDKRRIYHQTPAYIKKQRKIWCWMCFKRILEHKSMYDGKHFLCKQCYNEKYRDNYKMGINL